jgi:hypothetical protein
MGLSRIMVIKSLNMKLHKAYLRNYLGKHLEAYLSYKILKSYLGGYKCLFKGLPRDYLGRHLEAY